MKSDLTKVYRGNPIQAEMIKQMLEENGISCMLRNKMMGSIAPWLVSYGGENPVSVEVLIEDEEKAKELIEGFLNEG